MPGPALDAELSADVACPALNEEHNWIAILSSSPQVPPFFLLTAYALSIREGGWIKAFLIAIPVCLLAAIASYLLGCLHGNDCDLMWTLQPSYEECQTIPGLKWILQQSCLEHETRAKTYPAPMLFASDI